MASAKKKRAGYDLLRPHTSRVIKVAEYPMHVNGAYRDDPHRIALLERRERPAEKA